MFSITIKGVEVIIGKLARIPGGGWITAFLTVLSQLILTGLREYAPWKHVSRKQAYGVSFFSNKQQRAFFARLNSGGISVPYQRTGAQGKAWMLEGISGNTATIANRDPSVQFTRGQTALHRLMGWLTVPAAVKGANIMAAATRAAIAAIKAWAGF